MSLSDTQPRPSSDAEPFLAREALTGLMLAPPLLALVTSRFGARLPSFEDGFRCLISTWICIALVGLFVHVAVSFGGPRLWRRIPSRSLAIAAIAALTVAATVVGMVVVLPWLAGVDPHSQEGVSSSIARAVGLGLVYVAIARTVAVLVARARRSRFAELQAHASPHFLFNTLNTVASLIASEPAQAEATVERLAGVLQYSIAARQRARVTLGEELATVRDYLEIEQSRFEGRLQTRIDVAEELKTREVPPMLLQPLVENAVHHGLASREEGGEVSIAGRPIPGGFLLTVSDDGVGPGGSRRRGNGTGISSVRERLALSYGASGTLTVGPRPGGGFTCELRVPAS